MSVGALITWPYKACGRSRRGSPKAGTTVHTCICFYSGHQCRHSKATALCVVGWHPARCPNNVSTVASRKAIEVKKIRNRFVSIPNAFSKFYSSRIGKSVVEDVFFNFQTAMTIRFQYGLTKWKSVISCHKVADGAGFSFGMSPVFILM